MKNAIRALLLVSLVFGSALSFGQTLRSAAEPDYPPLSIVKPDGRADGFSVELLRAALSEMDRKVSFKTAPWNQIKNELAAGELDVLPLVGRTPEREKLYDFTVPYLILHGALFVRENESRITSLADLPGKRIAVMKGDNAEEYVLREKLSDQIISTTTFEEAFTLLSSGEADAVIAQKLMGVSLLQELGIRNIKVVGRPNDEFKQDFSFAVTKGNAELLADLNEGLALVVAKGTHRRLMNKWLGSSETISARSRVLIYGDDPTYPPYMFLDEQGRPSGFHVELLRAVAKKTGLEIIFQPETWSEVQHKMLDGELDITSMLYTPERDRLVDFSLPHSIMYAAVFTRTGAPPYTTIDDLKGQRIAVQNGDMLHEYALAQGWGDTLTVTEGEKEPLALLADGNVDFVLGYHIPGLYWIQQNGWKNIRTAEPRLMKAEYCFVVQKGNSELLDLLDDGLRQLKETGEYRTLYHKWLGKLDGTPRPLPLWFWIVAYGIGSAAILLFGINRLLKHQIKKRTAELRTSEERFDIATTAANIGVWERDLLTNCLLWDARMYALYGMPPGTGDAFELWKGAIHPDDVDRVLEDARKAGVDRKRFDDEFRIILPDGTIRYIRAFGKTIHDKNGTPVRMVGVNYNITESKQAEEALKKSEETFRSTIEDLQVGVVVHDADSSILLSNPQAQHLLGLTEEQIAGKAAIDPAWCFVRENLSVMKADDYPVSRAITTREKVSNITLGIQRPDREKITWVLASAMPVFTDQHELSRVVVNFIDITHKKNAEQQQRTRNNELERFNKAAVGREMRMIELKKEINTLCSQIGEPKRYR